MTTARRRATPADPMPNAATNDSVPSGTPRTLPPDLGPNAMAVLDGPTFMYSNEAGDIPQGSVGGLVHQDTRFLNRWELMINQAPLVTLSSCTVDDYSAVFFLANAPLPGLEPNIVGVHRQRVVGAELRERIELQCFDLEGVSIELRLRVGTDFADIFEIKDVVRDRSTDITRSHAPDGSQLRFSYRNGSYQAYLEVCPDPPATRVEGDDLVWDVRLEPHREWRCDLKVPLPFGRPEIVPVHRDLGEMAKNEGIDPGDRWRSVVPILHADSALLRDVFEKSVRDLIALRIEKTLKGQRIILPAAGLPWFLTVFGRDTLITAYQSVCFGQNLAHGALLALATHQGTEVDNFRDEEPGKILHEVRDGELTKLGLKPYDPYFGAADTTQLWLIVLSEYWRWTRDDDFVRSKRDNVHAALRWIDEYGDRDGDGYVEYGTRSPQGLGNQCWRDSPDGVLFSDGSIPVLPIATCEIQGYTYDAKLRTAELADGPLHDPELARRLRTEAEQLRERFNRDFWINERGGFYALGLDGDNRQIDSMTSNMGHLLWSGIVPQERAEMVARHLMSDDLFSGWGVRTISKTDRGYNPIGYHKGTVWPHDNSLIAHGLARYGFREEANRIAMAMLEAAQFSAYRLPEAWSGYDRSSSRMPVPYPTACSPQAWASGAPLLLLRTMLGFDARDGQLVAHPDLPQEIGRVFLAGTNAFGQRWDVEAAGSQSQVRLTAQATPLAPPTD
ncbi:glycogen debranching N-terminal domain-containing protein [Micromonospora sp. DPT]|uniref:amylo-alpha-1,6-glucosidase n=1 Tax=Micromonospora sp. DPT TaxID=3142975 RepID=UPI003208A7E4